MAVLLLAKMQADPFGGKSKNTTGPTPSSGNIILHVSFGHRIAHEGGREHIYRVPMPCCPYNFHPLRTAASPVDLPPPRRLAAPEAMSVLLMPQPSRRQIGQLTVALCHDTDEEHASARWYLIPCLLIIL